MSENIKTFEKRKQDHLRIALSKKVQTKHLGAFDRISLLHEALPDLDFNEISTDVQLFKKQLHSPIFISSMTAGHRGSQNLNMRLAEVAEDKGWAMGVGSQRRELQDEKAAHEWKQIRKKYAKVVLFGNIGVSQLITTNVDAIEKLVERLEATAMIVHTNPLQECFQPEGTPAFKGGLQAIAHLAEKLSVPVIVKETGCGFSKSTLQRLAETQVSAVDMSGIGGTHWGRVEAERLPPKSIKRKVAQSFADWGIATVDSLIVASEIKHDYQLWASGGVRSGVDAIKLLALGAEMVGVAQPILEAASKGTKSLSEKLDELILELKVALFCTGCRNLSELREKKIWEMK